MVFVHESRAMEQLILDAADGLGNIRPFDRVIQQHGDIVLGHGILRQVGKGIGTGAERLQAILIQLKEHHIQVLDAAFHGYFFAQQRQITNVRFTKEDVQPHYVIRPYRLDLLPEGEALHMGVAGHHFHHALGLAEQGGHILAAGSKGTGHMLALRGQLLAGIVGGGVVLIPEHLRRFKNVKGVIITLVLHHGLAQIGQQRGADEPLGGRRRCGQRQDAVGALQHGIDILLIHPGIGKDLLHAAAEGQILLDLSLDIHLQLVDGAVKGCGNGGGLEILIAIHPGHFLHDVGLDGHVAGGAPGGHHHMHHIPVKGDFIT